MVREEYGLSHPDVHEWNHLRWSKPYSCEVELAQMMMTMTTTMVVVCRKPRK
jgi:hypothetical protein